MRASWSRRRFAVGAGASLAALAGSRAAAQSLDGALRSLLKGPVPAELRALIPGEAFEAVGFVRQLIALEGEAKARRLPQSKLAKAEGEVPIDPEQLYIIAMPRLVALIDRAERIDAGFADKAGELLARLHATQHVVPDALGRLLAPRDPGGLRPLGLGEQAETLPPLALPPVEPSVSVPVVQPLPEPSPEPEPEPEPMGPVEPGSLLRSFKFEALEGEYRRLFAGAAVRPERQDEAAWHLTMMRQARPRYEGVAKRAGVPWQFIAAIHGMEASFNFRAHLHNGDFPLTQRTRQVPAGHPTRWLPPSDWESSAMDALRLLGFTGQSDWSLPRTLYRLEAFNGFGYRRLGRASPYLWSFSTLFDRGKFVADGRFDPRARSLQCGTATMLKLLDQAGELDLG